MKNNKIIKSIHPLRRLLPVAVVLLAVCLSSCSGETGSRNLRILYWNIQNGMWDGQGDNYDAFVEWVKGRQPDVCIWAEAQTIYETGTATRIDDDQRYLVDGWGELASRYGHKYWYVGGHRDNYPQVITSKYPIENVERIVGAEPDSVVTHGAGWARIDVNGKVLNLVTVHMWPQAYTYRAEDMDASRAAHGGDHYRRMEIEYICNHTIGTTADAAEQFWLMAGDFNSRSRFDNWHYGWPADDTRFLNQDYIRQNTPYVDIIAEQFPGEFKSTTGGGSRIDYVFCTPALRDRMTHTDVVWDEYTTPVRNAEKISNFWHPSDHLPIIVDFDIKKR